MISINSKPWLAIYRGRWLGWGIILVLLGLFWLTEVAQAQSAPPAPISYTLSQQIIYTDPDAPVALNDSISFVIVITNIGTTELSSLPLTYTFASQYLTLNFIYPPPDSDNGAGQLHWNNFVPSCGGPLPPQATCTIRLDFKAKQDTTLLPDQRTVNTAQSGDQQSSAGVRIDASIVRFRIEQQPNAQTVTPGTAFTITINISNTGVAIITSLPLTDTYNAQHLIFAGATPPADQGSAGQLKWHNLAASCGGAIAPQTSCAVVVAFVTLQELANTFNTVQSGSEQSPATVVIVAQDPNLVPLSPFNPWISHDKDDTASVAWGDVDGDGDLDLAVGTARSYDSGSPNKVYLNDGGTLQPTAAWLSDDADDTASVAWGDMDGDGDLDLAAGNYDSPSKVYRNEGGVLQPAAVWLSADSDGTNSVAWGDVDGDGDLDLAAGNEGANKIYLNEGGVLQPTAAWSFGDTDITTSVAWGDMDGDGDLDLATGNYRGSNKVYRNEGGVLQPTAAWSSADAGITNGVAWGDMDGDGDLDLATVGGGYGDDGAGGGTFVSFETNKVYRNEGGVLQTSAAWNSADVGFNQSVAWGDADGDGDLDLAAGNKIYLNQGLSLKTAAASNSGKIDTPTSIAWGDMDGDGDLDLALGYFGSPNKVYQNEGDVLKTAATWSSADSDSTSSVAWGDVDGDGDLDLAVGNSNIYGDGTHNKVYLNADGILQPAAWGLSDTDNTTSVAWGDMDGDGDLDLAVGNYSDPSKVYRNQGGVLQPTAIWLSADYDVWLSQSVAWGDVDGDGDLDLAVGTANSAESGKPNKVYLNDGRTLQSTAAWLSADDDNTVSVAWGDVDGDGDLDLAAGNISRSPDGPSVGDPNKVYLNEGGSLQPAAAWSSADTDVTNSVAWGDMDGDGDLDLAAGNGGSPNKVYLNVGGVLQPSAAWFSADTDNTKSVAWGDVDGDGDLDLAAGPNKIYLNVGGVLQPTAVWLSADTDNTTSVAWGDADGDGDLDLATGNSGSPNRVYSNMRQGQRKLPNNPPFVTITAPLTPQIGGSTIPLAYKLFDPEGDPVGRIAAFYSLNGGGQWQPAVATATTPTTNLTAADVKAGGSPHVFTWDTFASGFFGQSDNVVLRLQVYPQAQQSASPGTYLYPNRTPGLYQRPVASAATVPFRVRGTQVRVVENSTGVAKPAANALVYRLPANQATNALPITNQAGVAYHPDNQGYLQGRGVLNIGDRLVALAPITATESYTLYNMSATPTLNGLAVYTVTTAGVQTLTIAAAHPLLLFNLDVALEWDARKDTAFLNQLAFDLRRTAEFLFDASDGQATLGAIRLYHNKENWEQADIRIYASNALIPNADPGGIVRSEASETITANGFISATTPYSITYQPGHIRIGAVWNRFGEATGTLGEDWPRTLAHELGHYAFYLYDNYLGLQDGVVVQVDTCTNTLMADQYRQDFSEFHSASGWATDCAKTISAQRSGRADWQTITHFYPWLRAPLDQPQPGPDTLPLAVTQVQRRFATTATLPIDVAIFDLVDANGKTQQTSEQAQAVLYSQERLIDLGHPVVDKLDARGAHVGDRVCVYDLPAKRLGCETIIANDLFLTLVDKPTWQPEIVVSPISSRTVGVLVSNVDAGLTLQGKLYPENSPATPATGFVPWTGGTYSTTFQLSAGVLAGHIQVWVDEADSASNPRRESLTSYALGGSPGKIKKPAKGNRSLATTGQADSESVTPAISPDGQVLIYGNVRFKSGEFYALQKVNGLPAIPLWTTVVGDGYRILKSDGAPDLVNTSILFRYRGQDVPAGEEKFLNLYFWDEANQQWQRLSTVLNQAVNEASAQAHGPGLYVLMSSLEIPLGQAGWNLVAYPVQETRPVSQALASLANSYSTVYSYVATDAADPWKVYAPSAPAWVNDLKVLEFGRGYWINATQPMTWLVKGPDNAVQTASVNGFPTPPATYYGTVLTENGLTPAAGLPVQALINGVVCGESITQAIDGQIVYSLNVAGDGSRNPACIGAGQQVVIVVAGRPLGVVAWQNDSVLQVAVNGPKLYFPIILRGQ